MFVPLAVEALGLLATLPFDCAANKRGGSAQGESI